MLIASPGPSEREPGPLASRFAWTTGWTNRVQPRSASRKPSGRTSWQKPKDRQLLMGSVKRPGIS